MLEIIVYHIVHFILLNIDKDVIEIVYNLYINIKFTSYFLTKLIIYHSLVIFHNQLMF